MNKKQRTAMVKKIQKLQGLLEDMVTKLQTGDDVDFTEAEKAFFAFIGEANNGRMQTMLDELKKDSEKARQFMVGFLSRVTEVADTDKPEPEEGKPKGDEKVKSEDIDVAELLNITKNFIGDVFDEVKDQTQKARGKAGELAGDVTDAVKPTFDDLVKKGGDLWTTLTGAGKDWVKKRTFTPEFNSMVREELRKRNWEDSGIDTALAVFYQVLADMDKKKDEK